MASPMYMLGMDPTSAGIRRDPQGSADQSRVSGHRGIAQWNSSGVLLQNLTGMLGSLTLCCRVRRDYISIPFYFLLWEHIPRCPSSSLELCVRGLWTTEAGGTGTSEIQAFLTDCSASAEGESEGRQTQRQKDPREVAHVGPGGWRVRRLENSREGHIRGKCSLKNAGTPECLSGFLMWNINCFLFIKGILTC